MENLILLRKESQKTQQDLADYLGISRQAYSNYESSKRQPDYETLLKLGEYFNCSVDYLLGNHHAARSLSPELSAFDLSLIEHYHAAPSDYQHAVCKLLDLTDNPH